MKVRKKISPFIVGLWRRLLPLNFLSRHLTSYCAAVLYRQRYRSGLLSRSVAHCDMGQLPFPRPPWGLHVSLAFMNGVQDY